MNGERLIAWRCECGGEDCDASVEMTFSERDAVDHVAHRWAIAPGHAVLPEDEVIERHERYWVVASES